MKPIGLLLLVLAAAAFAATIAIARWAGMPGVPLLLLFSDAYLTVKMTDLALALSLPLVLLLGLIGGAGGSAFLRVMAWIAPALGFLVFAEEATRIWSVVQKLHVTNMKVPAPGFAEALLPFSLGLLVAALAVLLARPKSRRAAG